jgi:hybrid cluster-associated redox disulfide protein
VAAADEDAVGEHAAERSSTISKRRQTAPHPVDDPAGSLRQHNVPRDPRGEYVILAEVRCDVKRTGIDPDMTVDEIMRRWPATMQVFIRNKMICVGCPIGSFHTVKDACDAHDLAEVAFSGELLGAMRDEEAGNSGRVETRGT